VIAGRRTPDCSRKGDVHAQRLAAVNIGEAWRADGDNEAARESLERALALFREIGDDQGAGVALNVLGNLARVTGEYTAGRAYFSEALALRRAARDRREIGMSLSGMGMLALYAGDADGRAMVDEASEIFARADDGPGTKLMPINLAGYELDAGDPARAYALLEGAAKPEGYDLVGSRGWPSAALAEAAIALGDHDKAQRALDDALASFREIGEDRGVRHVLALAATLESRMSGC